MLTGPSFSLGVECPLMTASNKVAWSLGPEMCSMGIGEISCQHLRFFVAVSRHVLLILFRLVKILGPIGTRYTLCLLYWRLRNQKPDQVTVQVTAAVNIRNRAC